MQFVRIHCNRKERKKERKKYNFIWNRLDDKSVAFNLAGSEQEIVYLYSFILPSISFVLLIVQCCHLNHKWDSSVECKT